MSLLLYSEEMVEIKFSSDIPADRLDEVGFPSVDSVHIWPGYVCLSNRDPDYSDYSYNPDSHSYADAITPSDFQDFAIVIRRNKLLLTSQTSRDTLNTVRCTSTNDKE